MKKRKLNSKNPKYFKKTTKTADDEYIMRRVLLQNDGKVKAYGVYFDKKDKKEILMSGNTN